MKTVLCYFLLTFLGVAIIRAIYLDYREGEMWHTGLTLVGICMGWNMSPSRKK